MGFFDNYNEIEEELLATYSNEFLIMGLPDAKKTAKSVLDAAIGESKNSGTYNLPQDFGDIILGIKKAEQPNIEKVAEIFRRFLPQKRAEGVKDEDIRWWWNLNDVERKILDQVDLFHRVTLLISLKEKGLSEKERISEMIKAHPIYGEITFAKDMIEGDTKPLPYELKDRVNRYLEKRAKDDLEKIKQDLNGFSTFNAFVRKQIKKGNI